MSAVLSGVFRVTQDAEVRYTNSGKAVAGLSMAYKCGSQKGDDGYYPSQFIEAALWEKRAESMAPFLKKGTRVWAVIEEVRIETYEKRDGTQGHKLAGRIGALDFVGDAKPAGEQSGAPAQRAAQPARQAPPPSSSGFDDMSDDIPF